MQLKRKRQPGELNALEGMPITGTDGNLDCPKIIVRGDEDEEDGTSDYGEIPPWEHATCDSEIIRDYIKRINGVDPEDDQQSALIREILENVRYEERVVYREPKGNWSKEFSSMVFKIDSLDKDKEEFNSLLYYPLNDNCDDIASHIPDYPDRSLFRGYPGGVRESSADIVKLAQGTDALILFANKVVQGISIMLQTNTPTWVYAGMESLWNMATPTVYRLEIYLPDDTEATDELLDKIRDTFKDRCEHIEIAHWNEELEDYEWFIGGDDLDYLEMEASSCDPEDEVEDAPDNEVEEILAEQAEEDAEPQPIGKKTFKDYLETVDIPEGYTVSELGVWVSKEEEKGKPKKVRISSTGIMVVGLARTETQTQWMTLVVWTDLDGRLQEGLFPSEYITSSKECIAVLESRGCKFPFGNEKEIKAYLSKSIPETRYRLIERTGWYIGPDGSNQFALPTQIIGNSQGEETYFHSDNRNETGIGQKGTFEGWQKYVARAVQGNPLFVFALSVGFASPLLKIVGGETAGFHIHGKTSSGKTTATQVPASVWGNGEKPSNCTGVPFINTWKATGNGLENVAASRNDTLLVLDELGQSDILDFKKVVYDLSSGMGKERMTRKAAQAPKKQWRMLYLSNGEVSAKEKMELINGLAKAGQLIRLVDIDIEDDIVLDSHGESSVDFVDELQKNCGTHYGWAGPKFVEKLIETIASSQGHKELEDAYRQCIEILSLPNLEAEKQRVVKRFALVMLAGIYAVKYGIVPLSEDEIISSVQSVCSRWLGSTVTDQLSDSGRAIERIKDYLSANSSRFHDLDSGDNVPSYSILGYRKKIHGTMHYLFPTESFEKAMKGSNYRAVLRELSELGLLHKNNSDKNQARFNIPGSQGKGGGQKMPFYAISADILEYGQDEEDSSQ